MKTFTTLFAALTLAASAAAQTGTATVEADTGTENAFRFDLGVFSPVGEIGISYNREVVRHLEVEFGVGLGLTGVQLSALPKIWFGSEANRVYTGIGVSVAFQPGITDVWLNWDVVGYEHRFHSGVVLTVGAGWIWGLSGSYNPPNLCISDNCSPPQSQSLAGFNVPQAHVGVGYAF